MVISPQSEAGSNSFGPEKRVRQQKDFDFVWKSRRFAADHNLVINAGFTGANSLTRLGLSIGRKVGNAVIRNRWKRLIREAFRIQYSKLPPGLDLIVRPKAGAKPDFREIQKSLHQLAWRLVNQRRRH